MKAKINGIELAYELSGPEGGAAVVLHHPLATNHSFWDDLTARLSSRFRVLRFDARGHGQSEAPRGPYAFETLAGDVLGLMDHVAIANACFLGLSMGGMVGQMLGLEHAHRFSSLILASTTSRVPPEFGAIWDERIKTVRERGMASQVEESMPRWVSPQAIASGHGAIPGLKAMIRNTPPEGYCGWAGAIRTLDITDRLKAIRLPTLVVVGELDPSTPVAASQTIARAIPGSELVIMKGVAHMMSSEVPEEFHAHVRPFLERHGSA